MNKLVIIGATGKKSGGAFAKELSENLDKVMTPPVYRGGVYVSLSGEHQTLLN